MKAIVEQKCLFPNPAKDAASELKKLGVTIGGEFYPAANLDRSLGAEVEHQMMLGLAAESQDRYPEAEKRYAAALKLDPSDPAPRRYLGEVYRHQLGDWDNLAAIYAQAGQKDRALAMLKRHFFDYERYDAVRSKEMMEARVDAVFSSLFADPTFVSLTSGADGKLPLPKKKGKR